MKALYKKDPTRGIWMTTTADMPEIGPKDILIRIKKSSLCGTDMHIFNWDSWAQKTVPLGLIIGHEYMGIVEKIGRDVTNFSVGDRVSGEGHITCGQCRNCREDRRHLCSAQQGVGITRPGALAEYLSLPARNAVKLSKHISDDIAAILDPFGNAVHAASAFDVKNENVLITGAGPIGAMAAAVCKHLGASSVTITDINDDRLALARTLGARHCVNTAQVRLTEMQKELGFDQGFDIGLEMSGNEQALNDMIQAMRIGGSVALLGLPAAKISFDLSTVIFKGLEIKGIYGREIFNTWTKALHMIENRLDLSPIITHHFSIDDYEQAFETLSQGKCGKVILNWE